MKPWIGILLSLLLLSCEPDEIGPQNISAPEETLLEGSQVLVINEGNFGRGNASISAYSPDGKRVHNDLFQGVNAIPLGDVAQDLESYRGRYFISMNASSKIQVVDAMSWESQGSIDGLKTPYYLAFAGGKGFVTDLFNTSLYIIDPDQLELVGKVSLPSAGSEILSWQDQVFVACGSKLIELQPEAENISNEYELGERILQLAVVEERLFALLAGNPTRIVAIDADRNISDVFSFSADSQPRFMKPSLSQQALIVAVDRHLLELKLTNGVASDTILRYEGQNMYGLAADPVSGEIYIADALDYNQASRISRFSASGVPLDEFRAGLISNGFYFTNY